MNSQPTQPGALSPCSNSSQNGPAPAILRRGRHFPRLVPEDDRDQFINVLAALERYVDRTGKAIGFCGCSHRSGTTSVALSFFHVITELGAEGSLLVEANLRSPSLEAALRLDAGPGFAALLDASVTVEQVARPFGSTDARVIPAGISTAESGGPRNPERIRTLVDSLREQAQLVVFDLPPLTLYPDSAIVAPHLDGVVLVLEAERDRWEVSALAKRVLETARAQILGAVVNKQRRYIPGWLYRML